MSDALPQSRRQRGGRRGRRAPTTDTGTGGPIRPRQKKPPQPTGKLCCFGICCHFGTACVNEHTAQELQFFKQREQLRLQLRELALQVEAKKVEYKRQKLEARKPLQPLNSLLQAAPQVTDDASKSKFASTPTSANRPTLSASPIASTAVEAPPQHVAAKSSSVKSAKATTTKAKCKTVNSSSAVAQQTETDNAIARRRETWRRLAVWSVGDMVRITFHNSYFQSIAALRERPEAHALLQHGTGQQVWRISKVDDSDRDQGRQMVVTPVDYRLPIPNPLSITEHSVVGEYVILWNV